MRIMVLDTLRGLPPQKRFQKLQDLQKEKIFHLKELEKSFLKQKSQEERELVDIDKMMAQCLAEINEKGSGMSSEISIDLENQNSPFNMSDTMRVEVQSKKKVNDLDSKNLKDSKNIKESKNSKSSGLPGAVSSTSELEKITDGSSVQSPAIRHFTFDIPPEFQNAEYRRHLHEAPAVYLRQNVEQIYHAVQDKGYIRWEEKQLVEDIAKALEEKMQDYKGGAYNPSKPISEHVDVTRKIASVILGMQNNPLDSSGHNWYRKK